MPNPESNPPPIIPSAPANPAPPAGKVNMVNPNSEAQTKLAAELDKLFPGGVIPVGSRFNKEAELMTQAGRQSSLEAAAATPPGSTINAPVPTAPTVTPTAPTVTPTAPAPVAPVSTAPTVTSEDKAKQEAEAAAKATAEAEAVKSKEAEDKTRQAAIESAKNAGKIKLTEAEKDAAEKTMTPQAGTAFKAIRTELSTTKQLLQESERKIAEAETQRAKMLGEEEAQQLRDKVASYEKRLAIFDYENTAEFQTQVTVPQQRAEAELLAIAQKNSITEDDLRSALNDKDVNRRNDKLAEMSANFNRLDLNKFDRLIGALDDFKSLGDQLKQEASGRLAEYGKFQEQEQAKVKAQMKESWDKSLNATLDKLGTKMPIFKPTGDVEFDSNMSAAVQGVKEMDLSTLSNDQIAELFYKGNAFDTVLGVITKLHNKNVVLDARIQQLQGTAVPAGGGDPVPVEPAAPKFESMLDAVRSLPQQIQ